ncbi:MAG: ABC transporter permease [Gaiellaceae bacterium]
MRTARFAVLVSGKLVVTIFAVSVVVFFATAAIPGNPARDILGQDATTVQVQAFSRDHGLDKPILSRYGTWLADYVRGDWGTSYSGISVWQTVQPRLERTLVLAFFGFALGAALGVCVGLASGFRPNRLVDMLVSGATLTVGAVPAFVLGVLLAMVFSIWLHWLPVSSTEIALYTSPFHAFNSYVLPAVTLALAIAPYVTRLTRANARTIADESYVRSAVLRGVPNRLLLFRHVLPNAAPPIVNLLALEFVGSIAGVAVIETLFGFPGIGQLLVTSVGARDYPTIQALALLIGGLFVVMNVLADAIVAVLTPKLRATIR